MVTYFEKTGCKIRPCTKRCLQFPGYLDPLEFPWNSEGFGPGNLADSTLPGGFFYCKIRAYSAIPQQKVQRR